jgi:NADH-quinone oxidoreductase subunit B
MRIQDKVRAMKEYTKGQPLTVPVPKRSGVVMLPDELAEPAKALEFQVQNKEKAKPAKA